MSLKQELCNSYLSLFNSIISENQQENIIIKPDVLIICSNEVELPAHWFVLRTRCEYFNACYNFNENKEKIDGKDFDYCTWLEFLYFIYSGDLRINVVNQFNFLYISNYFLMEKLKTTIELWIIKQEIKDIIKTLEIAIQSNAKLVCNACIVLIQKDFMKFVDNCVQLKFQSVKFLLENLKSQKSQDLFHFIQKWNQQFDIEKQREHLHIFVPLLNIEKMSAQFIFENIEPLNIVDHTRMYRALKSNIIHQCNDKQLLMSFEEKKAYYMDLDKKKIKNTFELNYVPYCYSKYNNEVLALTDCQILNLQNQIISSFKDSVRYDFGNCVYHDDIIFIAGGYDQNEKTLDTMKSYCISMNEWNTCKTMKYGRQWFSLVCYYNELYALGGKYDQVRFKTVQVYDTIMDEWRNGPDLPIQVSSQSSIVHNNLIFSIGGMTLHGYTHNTFALDPREGKWQKKSNMLYTRSQFGLVEYNENLLAVCGENSNHSIERYDPKMDKWEIFFKDFPYHGACKDLIVYCE